MPPSPENDALNRQLAREGQDAAESQRLADERTKAERERPSEEAAAELARIEAALENLNRELPTAESNAAAARKELDSAREYLDQNALLEMSRTVQGAENQFRTLQKSKKNLEDRLRALGGQ